MCGQSERSYLHHNLSKSQDEVRIYVKFAFDGAQNMFIYAECKFHKVVPLHVMRIRVRLLTSGNLYSSKCRVEATIFQENS